MTVKTAQENLQWYQIPWFWIIISPLIIVVIACAITITIAVKNADDVVIGNYYKEGLLVNENKTKQVLATTLGLVGQLSFDPEFGDVYLEFSAKALANGIGSLPEKIQLMMAHPADQAKDFVLVLSQKKPAGSEIEDSHTKTYTAELPRKIKSKWYWDLSPIYNANDLLPSGQLSSVQLSSVQLSSVQKTSSKNENEWLLKGEIDLSKTSVASF